ncbi:hypothetical protein GGX14DRAFT_605598 [Mycena pura]|uniref:4a-hydroxytetrahydrobiopterin dehydratase n=1 Tax=Mycena pura TaxID=153505 RepID=A0AAD6VUN6_9AGAR|nr:hypothetical protein GGX14DRAFT_605598 [Mycena pura]
MVTKIKKRAVLTTFLNFEVELWLVQSHLFRHLYAHPHAKAAGCTFLVSCAVSDPTVAAFSPLPHVLRLFPPQSLRADPPPASISRTPLPEAPLRPLPSLFSSVQCITQEDLDYYMTPLYERNWRVFTEMLNMTVARGVLERSAHVVPMLGKKFRFLRARAAVHFLADLASVAKAEEHEPRITLFLGRKSQHAVVRMHTLRTLDDAQGLYEANVRPGLSSHDLRLAILLEHLFQEHYVASGVSRPLPALLAPPDVPDLAAIQSWQNAHIAQAAGTIAADANWVPAPTPLTPLPPLPTLEDEDAGQTCTEAQFEALSAPLYARGWRVAFLPIPGEDRVYEPTLCLTGFFRFRSFGAAVSFVRAVASGGHPRNWKDNAELHFLLDAQTVRAQLVYPAHSLPTVGNLCAALHVERIFHDRYFRVGAARVSNVHPYRDGDMQQHQPRTFAELQRTKETPMRAFHQRHNAMMAWMLPRARSRE